MISLGNRFTLSRVGVVAIGLFSVLAISVVLAVYAESQRQSQIVQAARVQARILADSVSAALAFNDSEAIQEYTSALRANPDIEAVGVYDDKGRLVAQFGAAPAEPGAAAIQPAGGKAGAIVVRVPVVENKTTLGMVYFQQRSETIGLRLARYSGAGLLVLVAGVMLTIMARDARLLALSNDRLRQEMVDRERAESALRQSQKMEAVGRLTGGIAHDFNNMLAVILGNNDLLLRRFGEADPKLLRLVNSSQEAGKRAATLTHRLLAFSRQQPLDPKAVDVGKAVTDMSELLRRTLGETIIIETARAAGLWRAHVDQGQLETAIVNLAVNARDAMPSGGKLTIETANANLDRTYANTQEEVVPGAYVLIAVTDTGTGIAPELLEKVFEPFFTTKDVGKGTGLGLSQVHGFVKQSGGHINIYSEVGHGTTIKIYLPRSHEEMDLAMPDMKKMADRDRRNVTVLVVDDEAGLRDFTGEALLELGYDVLIAENADQAMKIVESGITIHVLLTDVVMPGRSGRQLSDQVHTVRPDIRTLYMTGYTQNAIVHNGVLDSGTHLITKPFTISHLGEELDALLK